MKFTHCLDASIVYAFLFLNSIPCHGYTTICLPFDEHLTCFHFLAIANKAARNIHVQVDFCMDYISFSLGLKASSGMAGSYDRYYLFIEKL